MVFHSAVFSTSPERTELIFLALPVALAQFAAFAVEHGPREAVAPFAAVQLQQGGAAAALVVEIGEGMQGLVDSAEFGQCLRRRVGRSPIWSVRMMPFAGTRPSLSEPAKRSRSSQCRAINSRLIG